MVYAKKSVESRSIAIARHRAAKWRRVRFKDNSTVKPGDTFALPGCWCGEPSGHRWPGSDEGAPHPFPRDIPAAPPKVQARMLQIALQEAGVCPICYGHPTRVNPAGWPFCEACLGSGEFPSPSLDEIYKRRNTILKEEHPAILAPGISTCPCGWISDAQDFEKAYRMHLLRLRGF